MRESSSLLFLDDFESYLEDNLTVAMETEWGIWRRLLLLDPELLADVHVVHHQLVGRVDDAPPYLVFSSIHLVTWHQIWIFCIELTFVTHLNSLQSTSRVGLIGLYDGNMGLGKLLAEKKSCGCTANASKVVCK